MNSFALRWQGGFWLWSAAIVAIASYLWHLSQSKKKSALIALRGLALLCLILATLKPLIFLRKSIFEKPKILILIDHGHAMGGPAGKKTRLKATANWLAKNRQAILDKADISVFALSANAHKLAEIKEAESLKPAETNFDPQTTFAGALEQTGGFVPQRAWLFSDGNAAEKDLESAVKLLKVPVDAVAVGSDSRQPGLFFRKILSPDFAFLHGHFSLSVEIEAQRLKNWVMTLSLLKESQTNTSDWKIVSEKTTLLHSDFEMISASFTSVAKRLGGENYRLKAAVPGMISTTRDLSIPVVRRKYRIMFLAGRPSIEYVFLRRFIKSDPRRELVSFVILRNPQNPVFVPDSELSLIPFPAQNIFLRDISQFDLFILEDFSAQKFNLPPAYLNSLKRFVNAGGALLVLGGKDAFSEGGYLGTPLEEMLPVSLSSAIPDFTPGLFNPVPVSIGHPLTQLYATKEESAKAWKVLPPLDGYGLFSAIKSDGTPILDNPSSKMPSGQSLPVMAVRKFGRGRVMVISTDSLWRWKLGMAQNIKQSDFYDRFWTRAIKYLTGTLDISKLKFAPLPDHIEAIEPARFFFSVFDRNFGPLPDGKATILVTWTSPSGKVRKIPAHLISVGRYEVDLTAIEPGTNQLAASAYRSGHLWGKDAIRFHWQIRENSSPVQTDELKRAAASTGGYFFTLSKLSAKDLLSRLPPPVKKSETTKTLDPFSSPLWLALCVFLLSLEWILRRKQGLP
jgi:uncharacterized membrane protein